MQKAIIARARALGRPVIVATQVLESMRTEPRPTRAEVSDAATAVDQGADAIMLAGETAAGDYPVQAVEMLAAIIADAETRRDARRRCSAPTSCSRGSDTSKPPDGFDAFRTIHGRAMCEAAVTLASTGQAEAIVAVTRYGKTAQLLSSLRPRADHPRDHAVRRRGAPPAPLLGRAADRVGSRGSPRARARHPRPRDLSPHAVVVFININPDLSRLDANFLNVQRLVKGRDDADSQAGFRRLRRRKRTTDAHSMRTRARSSAHFARSRRTSKRIYVLRICSYPVCRTPRPRDSRPQRRRRA